MTMPVRSPDRAVISTLRYRFAWLPRRTQDEGWIWLGTYQVVDFVEGVHRVLGDPLNWFTRSWCTRTALRGDGKVFMHMAAARPRRVRSCVGSRRWPGPSTRHSGAAAAHPRSIS